MLVDDIFEYPFLVRIFNGLLSDQDKFSLIETSKILNNNKHKIRFNEIYKLSSKHRKFWYFNCLTKIKVNCEFKFPETVTHVYFTEKFNKSLKAIPENVNCLKFSNVFNGSLELLPNSIMSLDLYSSSFNIMSYEQFPKHLKILKLSSRCSIINKNVIPKSVLELRCHSLKRIEPGSIDNVEQLTFLDERTQNLDYFPKGLKKLKLITTFSRIGNVKFPETLEFLQLTIHQNSGSRSLNGIIPDSVKILYLILDGSCILQGSIPYSVTELHIQTKTSISLNNVIPDSVQKLYLNGLFYNLENAIPNSIKELTFGDDFNQPINDLIPNSVEILKFGNHFNKEVKGHLPNSIKHLSLGNFFNQPIDGCIPNNLISLKFGSQFNNPLDGALPSSLIHLELGFNFNQKIEGRLPQNLKFLKISKCFRKKLIFPPNLTHLILTFRPKGNINYLIPKSVTHLSFTGELGENVYDLVPRHVTYLTI